jgi:hypothetical protein
VDPDQMARAAAALDAWFCPGTGGYRVTGVTWDRRELESMHAALEAPTADAALAAFGVAPGSVLSTPEQDDRNRAAMIRLRRLLSCQSGRDAGGTGTLAERVTDVSEERG